MDMTETIGERLKRLRKAKKLSQAQLAHAVGLSQSAIGNIEAGTRGYGPRIAKIAEMLGVSAAYLQAESEIAAPGLSPAVSTIGHLSIMAAMERLEAAIDATDPDLRSAARDAVGKWLQGQTSKETAIVVLDKLPKAHPDAHFGNDRHAA